MEQELKDLGWANGWKASPEIVVLCELSSDHHNTDTFDRRFGFTHRVQCDKCGYFYQYDSS